MCNFPLRYFVQIDEVDESADKVLSAENLGGLEGQGSTQHQLETDREYFLTGHPQPLIHLLFSILFPKFKHLHFDPFVSLFHSVIIDVKLRVLSCWPSVLVALNLFHFFSECLGEVEHHQGQIIHRVLHPGARLIGHFTGGFTPIKKGEPVINLEHIFVLLHVRDHLL